MSKNTEKAQRALDEATEAAKRGDMEGCQAKFRQASIILTTDKKGPKS